MHGLTNLFSFAYTGGCSLGMSLTHFNEQKVTVDEWEGNSGVKRRHPINKSSGCSIEEELQVFDADSRWRLLEQAGVEKLNSEEGIECDEIRISRQECGCYCESCCLETCSCAINGITCHSEDEIACFPCSCSEESCKNPEGRTEYDGETINNAREVIIKRENEKLESMITT